MIWFSGWMTITRSTPNQLIQHKQPPAIQKFLLQTSLLDRMCASLCNAVLLDASVNAQETLEDLERANLGFCPNLECPARGLTDKGNIQVHSQKDKRYYCAVCQRTFSASKGTLFYPLRSDPALK